MKKGSPLNTQESPKLSWYLIPATIGAWQTTVKDLLQAS